MQSTAEAKFDVVEVDVKTLHKHTLALTKKHRDELATEKDIMVLNPDMGKYLAMEEVDALLCLLCMNRENVVGYSVGFITNHLHYKDLIYYQNDVLFVDDTVRRMGAGKVLVEKTEALVKERGGSFITWHAKEKTPLCSLMEAEGYRVQDIVYSKRL